jgi:hypothetical protein
LSRSLPDCVTQAGNPRRPTNTANLWFAFFMRQILVLFVEVPCLTASRRQGILVGQLIQRIYGSLFLCVRFWFCCRGSLFLCVRFGSVVEVPA